MLTSDETIKITSTKKQRSALFGPLKKSLLKNGRIESVNL
jgi:ribosomal protein L17